MHDAYISWRLSLLPCPGSDSGTVGTGRLFPFLFWAAPFIKIVTALPWSDRGQGNFKCPSLSSHLSPTTDGDFRENYFPHQ